MIRCLLNAVLALLLVSCGNADRAQNTAQPSSASTRPRAGNVIISGDDAIAKTLTWQPPAAASLPEDLDLAKDRAREASQEGRLFADSESAIPLYLAIQKRSPGDKDAASGLVTALQILLINGHEALSAADDDIVALRNAHAIAAVARTIAPQQKAVQAYLMRLDLTDRVWNLNREGERALQEDRLDLEAGALEKFREALRLRPGQARALQGLAAVESGLIRRAEIAASDDDFAAAERWLAIAATVRPGYDTIADGHVRIERIRRLRIDGLRDLGVRALQTSNGIVLARQYLASILEMARPADPAAADLRQRIELATHYGLFRPGQAFTDALKTGARGPQMRVVPHGGYRMGAKEEEPDSADYERPQRYIRFDRGFAMSITETTVGEFRKFIEATRFQTRAQRRGFSMAYDERSGNFIRRSNADWRSDYAGRKASDALPVLHISANDAQAYVEWLSEQTGKRYRLPSEAEFEYALRSGSNTRYPWGNNQPPSKIANVTGQLDRSLSQRRWSNAFAKYGDGFWAPAPVGRFSPNTFGLHDLSGNVSEWVADCWHDGYRRAPKDGAAWVNPGCRTRVIRGGSWASSPAQSRSAWRAPADINTTNARIGFRVVREL